MKDKKGAIEISGEFILHLIFALFLIVVLVVSVVSLLSILEERNKEANCLNDKYWNNARGLKEILKQVDKGENQEFFFDNDNCNLVSFSFLQGIEKNKIGYTHPLPKEPRLCLCRIENSLIDQDLCKPYDCYKFKNYDQINDQQLSTEPLKRFVFLKFTKDGKTLRIETVGTEKGPKTIKYTKGSETTQTDPTNLMHSLEITFNTRQIKSFTPIIKIVEQQEVLTPGGIQNIEGFTTFFDLDLAQPKEYGQTDQDYVQNHNTFDPSLVTEAKVVISLAKEKFESLTEEQRVDLRLYYKPNNEWESERLICTEGDNTILCSTSLNKFSSKFAISAANGES